MASVATKCIGTLLAASAMLAAVVPAEARHRHRDRIDGGDILAGIVLIGAIAAIAGSGQKDRDRDRRSDDYRPDPQWREDDNRASPEPRGTQWVPGSDSAETRAVDACSWAAEGQLGDAARVGQIDAVSRDGDGWRVTGNVAAPDMMPRDFSCLFRGGRVTEVALN